MPANACFCTVGASPQPFVKEEGTAEIHRDPPFSFFRNSQEDGRLTVYKVPDEYRLPVCWVQILVEGNISDAAMKLVPRAAEALARAIAENAVPRPN